MTHRRRVLVLNHFAVPRDQPGGTRHIELFDLLEDWEFSIIAGKRNLSTGRRQEPSDHFLFVPVTGYNRNGPKRIVNWCSYALTATLRALCGPRPCVVYASSPHLLTGLVGLILSRIYRAKFVFEVRDLWPKTLAAMGALPTSSRLYRMLEHLERALYRHAHRIIALAPGTVEELFRLGVAPANVVYLPNAADPADFTPTKDRTALRARFGFSRITGVYAGAHGPANGLDLLIEAAQQTEDLDVDIVLIGDGLTKGALQRQVNEAGISNVRFLDPMPKSDIPDLLSAADFGVHVLADVDLFRSAVSPNKLFDYLAAGIPVVTNCPGAVASIVSTARAGWATAPRGLADGITAAAGAGSAQRHTLGNNGRSWIAANQSRRSCGRQLQAVLDDLVPPTSASATE